MAKPVVAFTGGRDYRDEQRVYAVLELIRDCDVRVGDCPTGLDAIVWDWFGFKGNEMFCPEDLRVFRADWNKHGKAAGPIRNREMLAGAKVLIAFPGGKGTADCVRQAKAMGVTVLRVEVPDA